MNLYKAELYDSISGGGLGPFDWSCPLRTSPNTFNDLAGARPNNTQKGFQLNFQKLTDVQTLKIFNASSLFAYCLISLRHIGKLYELIRLQQAGALD